jgi:Lon protease-like protein
MVRDCQAGAGVMALANVPGEALREGRNPPRVLPVIGAGILARVDPQPDGRSNIVLRGVRRARIVEELPTQEPYRLVRAEALAEPPADAVGLERSAEQLRQLVLALCARHPGAASTALAQMAGSTATPGDLADAVGAMILESPQERQQLLETASAEDRLRRVAQRLAVALAQAQPGHGTLPN